VGSGSCVVAIVEAEQLTESFTVVDSARCCSPVAQPLGPNEQPVADAQFIRP
jgi:hypothetical protein